MVVLAFMLLFVLSGATIVRHVRDLIKAQRKEAILLTLSHHHLSSDINFVLITHINY